MIPRISTYPEGPQRDALINMVANQMKKAYVNWNKDNVDNHKILDDLCEMSNGEIKVSAENVRFVERKENNFHQKKNNNNKRKK